MSNSEFGLNLFTFIIAILLVIGFMTLQVKIIMILVEWLTQGALVLTLKQGFALRILSDILFKTRLLDLGDTKKE